VNVVQAVMGHEQASTTLNRYTHVPADTHARVRAALNAPAARDWRGLAVGASPTIASTARRPGRDDPQMRSDQPAIVGH